MPAKKGWHAWHFQHGRKRWHATWPQARQARRRLFFRSYGMDWGLRIYECRWGPHYRDGPRAGRLHYHVGHTRPLSKSPSRRTWWRTLVVWPYYRARRRIREHKEHIMPLPFTKKAKAARANKKARQVGADAKAAYQRRQAKEARIAAENKKITDQIAAARKKKRKKES